MVSRQQRLERIKKRLGEDQFGEMLQILDDLTTYQQMTSNDEGIFGDGGEPLDFVQFLERLDELYNPFSDSSLSTTKDVVRALERESKITDHNESRSFNRKYSSKIDKIIKAIEINVASSDPLLFIRTNGGDPSQYYHPSTNLTISKRMFRELEEELEGLEIGEPRVRDSYIFESKNGTSIQRRLSSFHDYSSDDK